MTPPSPKDRAEKFGLSEAMSSLISSEIEAAVLEERKYWQEFMRLNKFEDHSQCRLEAAEAYINSYPENVTDESCRLYNEWRKEAGK